MRRLRRLFQAPARPHSAVVTEDSFPVLLTSVAPVREPQEPQRVPDVPPRAKAPTLPKRSVLPPPPPLSE